MSLVPYKLTALARLDTTGLNIIPYASVSVFLRGTGSYATLKTDSTGATPLSNPFLCDVNGEKEFWANGGNYSISVAGGQSWDISLNGDSDITKIDTWAAIASATPSAAGQLFTLAQHTSGGLGGGDLMAFLGSVSDDGGTQKNALGGFYLKRVNYSELYVEMFGALGGGVNDNAAFLAMAAATGGTIRMQINEYLVGQLNLPDYTALTIIGGNMPSKNLALTKLIDGSIMIGGIASRSTYLHLEKFGLDSGSARALSGVPDGGVFNALTGANATSVFIENVSVMGPTSAGTTHGLLIQGHESGKINNVYAGKHQYGVVVKGRNMQITNVDGDDCRTALLYPKSDVPAFAASVGDATANKFTISGVSHRAASSNTTAAAVYLHASTAAFAEANVTNVFQDYGECGLKIQGSSVISDPPISGVNASNISTTRATYTAMANGYTYDWSLSNITANNNSSGKAIYMDANAIGYTINGVKNIISDAAITGAVAMELFGIGVWDNIAVRNPFRTMTINVAAGSLGSIRCGKVAGDVRHVLDTALTGQNGAVAGTEVPVIRILPNSVVKLSGRFDLTASANKFFCNIPVNTGKQQVFACGGIDSGGNYVTTAVRLNDFQLSIEPSLPAGFQRIDLSNILINL